MVPISAIFSSVSLPAEATADDLISCHDRMAARVDVLVVPKNKAGAAKKKKAGDPDEAAPKLPEGLAPIAELPSLIANAWRRFSSAVAALEKVRDDRASALAEAEHAKGDLKEQAVANQESDEAWRALEMWLGSQMKLRDDGKEPSPVEARWLYTQVFPLPEGLQFIKRRSEVQWGGMKTRMRTLAGERAQAVITGFGGGRHYEQLTESHQRFGDAFGYREYAEETPAAVTDTRPEAAVVRDTLRELILKLEAYADPAEEGTEAVAAFLLRPFEQLQQSIEAVRRAAKKPEPTDKTPPA